MLFLSALRSKCNAVIYYFPYLLRIYLTNLFERLSFNCVITNQHFIHGLFLETQFQFHTVSNHTTTFLVIEYNSFSSMMFIKHVFPLQWDTSGLLILSSTSFLVKILPIILLSLPAGIYTIKTQLICIYVCVCVYICLYVQN